MGPFRNLIATSAATYRYKLFTGAGLEKLLAREVTGISKDCSVVAGGRCYIDVQSGLESLWKVVLTSRLTDQIWMHICEPFPVKHIRSFKRTLNSAEWNEYIPFSANLPVPYIKVNVSNSRIYHTSMVKKLVTEVIKAHCHRSVQLQGDELPVILKRRGHIPISPNLMVNIDTDVCEVLANCSGDLFDRDWLSASSLDPRIRPSAVAAVVSSIDLPNIINTEGINTIWDPLCHNGMLLIELYSLLEGHLARHPEHAYPLNNFPLNSRDLYLHVLGSIERQIPIDHPIKLIGSDLYTDHVDQANACLEKYRKSVIHRIPGKQDSGAESPPMTRINETNISIEFSASHIADNIEHQRTMILCNLYYGRKDKYKDYLECQMKFEEMLCQAPSSMLKHVYVIATDGLRRRSRFEWEPILRFNNCGIIVMLLKLKHMKYTSSTSA
ncbi:hypothetical protein BBOV_III008410 [Babesia bovis T2Bo]|uniref:THUMP domain-containing protein n=1 Tax=Babesia bovis TaxID=5865 RepID=A7APB7_BABBO|nr:hypothetical protein BBOV_III008410 [Babesia bovis T2Bo]EDO08401.1 hypothetical protein BBOV_III008410 [Babesia bovis T2Bo]|eukprot:XP_001611969.1 hypothetical protein [Babesia bovis T2Bo]